MDEPWNAPLITKRMSFLVDFLIKTTQLIKYAPKCQFGITNMADEIINM